MQTLRMSNASGRRILAIFGLLTFVAGVGLALFLVVATWQAQTLDDFEPWRFEVEPCDEVSEVLVRRVMSETETQALTVMLSNTDDSAECHSKISLYAPDFDVSPPLEAQSKVLPPSGTGAVSWILSTKKTGSFEVVLDGGLGTHVIGIRVTNVFGLSPLQVRIFSMVGTFLGPILSLPWWIERWEKRREPKMQDHTVRRKRKRR